MITELKNDDYIFAGNIFFNHSLNSLYPIVVTAVMFLILLAILEHFHKRGGDRKELNEFAFPNEKLIAAVAFTFITVNLTRHYGLLDEVSINLKHSYNL
jgi:hypothetical protein